MIFLCYAWDLSQIGSDFLRYVCNTHGYDSDDISRVVQALEKEHPQLSNVNLVIPVIEENHLELGLEATYKGPISFWKYQDAGERYKRALHYFADLEQRTGLTFINIRDSSMIDAAPPDDPNNPIGGSVNLFSFVPLGKKSIEFHIRQRHFPEISEIQRVAQQIRAAMAQQ